MKELNVNAMSKIEGGRPPIHDVVLQSLVCDGGAPITLGAIDCRGVRRLP